MTREHIGDLVCTTPALRSLRRLYPDAHMAVEVGERAACVLEHNPDVDEILPRPTHQGLAGKIRFIRLLRQRKFDLGVVLDDSADMSLYLWLGGVPRRVGLLRKPRFSRLFTDGVVFDPYVHEMVDNFLNVIGRLGGEVSDPLPEVFPNGDDIRAVDRLFAEARIRAGETLVALNPGASTPANRWPPEQFAALGDLLAARPQTRVLLLGGPEDGPLAGEVCRHMIAVPTILTGRMTVLELAEVLRRCDVVVSGDTGPMHLACAVGTPVVALFGPAVPYQSGPTYARGHVMLRKVSGCPNCTKHRCQEAQRCMRLITAEEVAEAVAGQLERVRPVAVEAGAR